MVHHIHSKLQNDNAYTDQRGNQVVIKGSGITTVSDEDLEHLTKNKVFKLHASNGFMKIAAAPVDEAIDEQDDEAGSSDSLLGSETQPSSFTLADDSTVLLGDVVRKAFEDSGKTEKQWNKLTQKTRDAAIDEVVAQLDLKEEA